MQQRSVLINLDKTRNCKTRDGSLQSQGLFSWDTFNRKEIGMKL